MGWIPESIACWSYRWFADGSRRVIIKRYTVVFNGGVAIILHNYTPEEKKALVEDFVQDWGHD